jgi:hypothetical protein
MAIKTSHKAFIFLALVFLMGYLDWLTTVTGLLSGGIELNPLLAGLTQSSMLLFSVEKLTAVALAGFAAYKAANIARNAKNNFRLTNKFVNLGVSVTVLALGVVVMNNMIVVFKL